MKKNDTNRSPYMSDDLKVTDLLKVLSKPMRTILSLAAAITGLSICGFAVVIVEFEKIIAVLGQITLDISVAMILLLVCIGAFCIGMIFIACASIVALVRIKILNQSIKDDVNRTIEKLSNDISQSNEKFSHNFRLLNEEFSHNISQLNDQVNQSTLSRYILDEEQITALESGMFCGGRIIVMTSKFHLDTGKLLQIILNNIKRGAIYQYIVPGRKTGNNIKGKHHSDFTFAYTSWWNLFKDDLLHEETAETLSTYHPEYQKLKKDALKAGNIEDVRKNAQLYFSNHVQEYLVRDDYSLVTIIMYQKGFETEHNYDIIVKLPTISDGSYYAFKIPDEEKAEKKDLSDIIEGFCRRASEELKLG